MTSHVHAHCEHDDPTREKSDSVYWPRRCCWCPLQTNSFDVGDPASQELNVYAVAGGCVGHPPTGHGPYLVELEPGGDIEHWPVGPPVMAWVMLALLGALLGVALVLSLQWPLGLVP